MATETDPARSRRPRWKGWFRYTIPGLTVAVVFACLSFTPSLLPRSPLLQGALCGVNAAIGYGVGVLLAWIWRAFADREERTATRGSYLILAAIAGVSLVVCWIAGLYWQSEIRDYMDDPGEPAGSQLLLPIIAVVLFVLLVAAARGLRRLYRWIARRLDRWIGHRAATAIGWAVVVVGVWLLVSGVLAGYLIDAANQSFSVRNGITKEGAEQPTTATRSGGPGSLVSWDSLGREGRSFVSGGPSTSEITAWAGSPATEPIRAYAGLETTDESEDRAAAAVQDLERAGGFDREYLLVVTTTGSGWISPGAADAFEYITGGDSAMVGIQYSYLPSWISYLVDQAKAREAGRDLFDAVYEKWSKLPSADRPKLMVFGESLGTFGGEAAFSGEADLANRTDGALLTGPPNFNELYREFTDNREGGTPEIEPVFKDGRTVRVDSGDGIDPPPTDAAWDGTRVLYVSHPSDPIVYWSPNLILDEPDWLDEPRGRDVSDDMNWFPLVTFWQVSADLPGATAVPSGHGHDYDTDYVDAWAKVLRPAGWTTAKRDALQQIISPADGS